MTQNVEAREPYLFERSDRETRRLMAQGRLYEVPLARLFEDAGLAEGMRVLDIGSGAGDVAFVAARAVGPSGSVAGVELNPKLVERARGRTREFGLNNVSFLVGDLNTELVLDGPFDALVVRFVLGHLNYRVATLRRLLEHVGPGGLVIFQEIVQRGSYSAFPTSPAWERRRGLTVELITRSGRNPLGGLAIHRTLLAAGLPAPEMRAHAAIINSAESPHLSLFFEAMRSLMPRLLELDIATSEDADVDTLERQVRADFAADHIASLGRLTIDAWTRKP
jgi:SAM-dependent methyltransferase